MSGIWTPTDWQEYSRRWSVLYALSTQLLLGYNFALKPGQGSQFWHRYPTGRFNRPFFAFEKLRGAPSRSEMGDFQRRNEYQLIVLMAERSTGGKDGMGDALLDAYNEELIAFLHERTIPFYDFRNGVIGGRVADYDFPLIYLSDARESEKKDRDRNVLTIQFAAKI